MREIIAADQPFERFELPLDEAKRADGRPPLQAGVHGPRRRAATRRPTARPTRPAVPISFYRNSPGFVDMCRGPHVPSHGRARPLRPASAWPAPTSGAARTTRCSSASTARRGSDKDDLTAHLHRLEEAAKRDHRKLGVELDLFSFPERGRLRPGGVPPQGRHRATPHGGLLPRAATRRRATSSCTHRTSPSRTCSRPPGTCTGSPRACSPRWSCTTTTTPTTRDAAPTGQGTKYYLKPMNCPFHILIFRSRQRSYRELPLRMFEFGSVYRYEKSGVVHGLTRVRGMTQDDAHIFTTKEQMGDELGLAAGLRARPAAGLRPRRLLPRAVDQARGQGGGQRRGVGRGHRGAAVRGGGHGPRAGHGPGGRRVLRAEDLGAGPRRHRADLADVDHPGRLPAAAALRAGVRRCRRRAPPADHDPPGAVRLGRAVLRRAGGALRRGVPGVAGAGAGRDPAGGRRPPRLRPRGRRGAARATGSASRSRLRTTRWASGSAGPRAQKLPYVLVVGDDDVAHRTVGVNPRGGEVERNVPRRRRFVPTRLAAPTWQAKN